MRVSWFQLAVLALVAGVSQPGCGYTDQGLGPPDIGIGPVADLEFELDNATGQDVFIDWTDYQGHFAITRSGHALLVEQGCLPLCGEGCACIACDPVLSQVRRVASKQTVTFSWTPVHYAESTCQDDKACVCVNSWPLTAGNYEVVFHAYTTVHGGVPSKTDPDVIVGPSVDSTSPLCEARASFALAPAASVRAIVDCNL